MGVWSDEYGKLFSYQTHQATTLLRTGEVVVSSTIYPILRKGYLNNKIQWGFSTQNDIPYNGKIIIVMAATWPFTMDATALCQLQTDLVILQKAHTCSIAVTANTQIVFSLTSLDSTPFKAGNYILVQYNVDNNNLNNNNINF